jgi:outer membrane protein TolC
MLRAETGGQSVRGRLVALGALCWIAPVTSGAESAPLPTPLTLEQALALADETHPDLDLARADLERSRARLIDAEARSGARLLADLTPERAQPSAGGPDINDSRARILLSKQLTDFGRQAALEAAAGAELVGRELALIDSRQRRRLDIMRRFFDVLLADLRYAVDNEDMAHRYVTYDRVRQRHELGHVSEVELLESENAYREVLIARTESEKRQAGSRLQLAVALNRPNDVPGELVRPALADLERDAPDYKTLLKEALDASPVVIAARKEVEAAARSVEAARARNRPVLTGEAEAAQYNEARGLGRNDWRIGLNLRIPLYDGGETDADIARAASEHATREARLKKAEQELQQAVLDLVQEIETLKVRRTVAKQRLAYRDTALERTRSLYELEVQANLGDALVRLTEAQYLAARADFELALAWARVEALTGRLAPASSNKERTP